jgi:uncharacterized membrane protein HdeD (DUF308 family)
MTQDVSVSIWIRSTQIGLGSLVVFLSILAVIIPEVGQLTAISLIAVSLSLVGIENIFSGVTVPYFTKKSRIIGIGLGIAILAFGIFTISNPASSIKFLILVIAIALLINGIVRVVGSRSNKNDKKGNQTVKLITGIISIALGIFVLVAPEMGFIILVLAIVIALVIQGLEIIIQGIRGKRSSIIRK